EPRSQPVGPEVVGHHRDDRDRAQSVEPADPYGRFAVNVRFIGSDRNSGIVIMRSHEHRPRTPLRSMLQHAALPALLLLVTACAARGASADPPGRYAGEVFPSVSIDRGLTYRDEPSRQLDLYRPADDD